MSRLLLRHGMIVLFTLFGVACLSYLIPALSPHTPDPSWADGVRYLSQVMTGDFGRSEVSGKPVLDDLLRSLPATIELALVATVLAVGFGVTAGVVAAQRRGGWLDRSIGAVTLIGYSLPVFWFGFLLVIAFALELSWLPASGRTGFLFDIEIRSGFLLYDSLRLPGDDAWPAFADVLSHLILPAIALAFLPMSVVARITRNAMTESLASDYVRMARGQGITEWRLVWRHALRNALLHLLSVLGLQLSTLVTGLMLVENIFSWPGSAHWLLTAFARGDVQSVRGGVLALAVMVVLINTLMDLLHGLLNPHVRRPT